MLKYSVVIPVKDDVHVFKTIDSYLISKDHQKCECIIVSNGSSDSFKETLLKHIENTELKIICLSEANISLARNEGINAAIGEYIVFIDSDNLIPLDYFIILEKELKDSDVLNGMVRFQIDHTNKFSDFSSILNTSAYLSNSNKFLYTPNLIVRKQIYSELGGYNPLLSGSEDADWGNRCVAAGKYMIRSSQLLVTDNIPELYDQKKYSWKKYGYGYGHRLINEFCTRNIGLLEFINKLIIAPGIPFKHGLYKKYPEFCLRFYIYYLLGEINSVIQYPKFNKYLLRNWLNITQEFQSETLPTAAPPAPKTSSA